MTDLKKESAAAIYRVITGRQLFTGYQLRFITLLTYLLATGRAESGGSFGGSARGSRRPLVGPNTPSHPRHCWPKCPCVPPAGQSIPTASPPWTESSSAADPVAGRQVYLSNLASFILAFYTQGDLELLIFSSLRCFQKLSFVS